MGGRPITAMAIAGMPSELDHETIREIFRGGAEKAREAECALVGGHTIKNPEPIYGLSVTGLVHPQRYTANALAKPGQILVLSKPLGTGIISSAIKGGKCSESLARRSVESMTHLNRAGAALSEKGITRACTDVTGFGLLGHLLEVCKASGVTAELDHRKLPIISDEVLALIDNGIVPGGTRGNLKNVQSDTHFADSVPESYRLLAADAQTSGGLLYAVDEEKLQQSLGILEQHNSLCAQVIGQITYKKEKHIYVS